MSLTGNATGAYNSKDVATATTVTFSGVSASSSPMGDYTVTDSTQAATITPKALTYTGLTVPASKVYDGGTTAVVSGTATLQGTEAPGTGNSTDGKPYSGDSVSLTGNATGTYNSKDVPTATTVTFGGLSASSSPMGDYTVTPLTQAATITNANTTTAMVGTTGTSTYGQSVTFTATVTNISTSATPTGTVTFKDGGTSIGTGILSGSGSTGTATFTTPPPTLLVGVAPYSSPHTITAVYNGDTDFNSGGTSANHVVQTVQPTTLYVTNVTPTATGFTATFNRAVKLSVLNLYDINIQTGGFFGPAT